MILCSDTIALDATRYKEEYWWPIYFIPENWIYLSGYYTKTHFLAQFFQFLKQKLFFEEEKVLTWVLLKKRVVEIWKRGKYTTVFWPRTETVSLHPCLFLRVFALFVFIVDTVLRQSLIPLNKKLEALRTYILTEPWNLISNVKVWNLLHGIQEVRWRRRTFSRICNGELKIAINCTRTPVDFLPFLYNSITNNKRKKRDKIEKTETVSI